MPDDLFDGSVDPELIAEALAEDHLVEGFFVGKGNVAGERPEPSIAEDMFVIADKAIPLVDDLDLFCGDRPIVEPGDIESLFIEHKKQVFGTFDFLAIKSGLLGNVPLREKDLVLTDIDHHTIAYLKGRVKDRYALINIARCLAFEEMAVREVRFRKVDSCPICSAVDGAVFSTGMVATSCIQGNPLLHEYCECDLEPVIRRNQYQGPLSGHLDIEEVTFHGKRVLNLPREMQLDSLISQLSCTEIEFRDLAETNGMVVVEKEDKIFVHNSYIFSRSPRDFIREYIKAQTIPAKIIVDPSWEVFYLGGRRVVSHDGCYWDADTGEPVRG